MTGLAIKLDGVWAEFQLGGHLQKLFAKYRTNFDGAPRELTDIEAKSQAKTEEDNN